MKWYSIKVNFLFTCDSKKRASGLKFLLLEVPPTQEWIDLKREREKKREEEGGKERGWWEERKRRPVRRREGRKKLK